MSRIESIRMVDISGKEIIHRKAEAEGVIRLRGETLKAIKDGRVMKGEPLRAAEVACIMAVKRTHEIIPLCHPVPITSVKTEFKLGADSVTARCRVTADYRTGVEMEALAGVTAALLTIWDMVKYIEKDEKGQYPLTSITDVRVLEKRKER